MKKLVYYLLFLALSVALSSELWAAEGFTVIINADNPATEMDAKRIAKIFLKKSKRWEDGEAAVPVDQLEDSEVRELFTRAVHNKNVSAIKSYWQRMIFSGRDVPPRDLASDQAVIEFVQNERGAIGYVSSNTELSSGVKELIVVE